MPVIPTVSTIPLDDKPEVTPPWVEEEEKPLNDNDEDEWKSVDEDDIDKLL